MIWITVGASVVATAVAALRWLRVAQREHYLPGVTRFAVRWWRLDLRNALLLAAGVLAAVSSMWSPPIGLVTGAVAVAAPIGLGLRGRTSELVWTDRLARLVLATAVLAAAVVTVGSVTGVTALVVIVPLLVPVVIDLALWLLAPLERRRGDRWIQRAAASLARVDPTVVAITGSYGKTSTKNLVAHLVGGMRAVSASPASFNNRMGLARAINEHLTPGIDIFIAEMGTYGVGEIRDLCEWIPPDVAVITALGPVHLERMRSLAVIAAAKREILERAPVAVISIDHPLLAEMATAEAGRRRVTTVSAHRGDADITATADGVVLVGSEAVGTFRPDRSHPVNVACAIGVIVALGIDPRHVADRLADAPEVAHRRTVGRSGRGVDIIDDTFNSNPAGAEAALGMLAGLGSVDGRKVVVTPGMVELGDCQDAANREFGQKAGAAGVTHFVIVNRTNRRALAAGAEEGGVGSVIVFDTREDAVVWVRDTLIEGDAVLYENDLPDHYP
ncbi:MAG TPA: UDP-N-acetylmuramoyl-tripeptide--D-alanyl-D-alanine ligase [Acidimicrobiia bacterium]|nr:UDP-N-acetylmuramoyl-tripeptide--D-alanyl-D-alanine ligase [Acidimicrobiia bacterium]